MQPTASRCKSQKADAGAPIGPLRLQSTNFSYDGSVGGKRNVAAICEAGI
jgi:hypothetical protein